VSDKPAFLHSYSRPAATADTFIRIVEGQGARVRDAEGRDYVDALASLWYCNAGHGRVEIADAVRDQMVRLAGFHTFDRFTNDPAEALTERLAGLAPMDGARVFLTSGGSESVDTAIKLARVAQHQAGHTQRTLVISRAPSYHGVSYGAVSATGLPANQAGFGPLVPDVIQVPHDSLDAIDEVLAERGDQLAAIISEPVVGAGGVLPPGDGYLQGLRERCDRHGGFLILDEVITGFGRLGHWFGAQRYGVRPDMVTFAKAVTSGYQPLGGVLVGPEVLAPLEADSSWLLRHGYTYGGHPSACAAALANLDIFEREGLVERAVKVGQRLESVLRSTIDGDRIVGVRGDGAVWAAAFGDGIDGVAVRDRMLEHGVIARPIGPPTMAFCPPLVITDDDIDRCGEALSAAVASLPRG
jgi:adenosylmethionine-8-amino-7-oxononanoate aminotransferase